MVVLSVNFAFLPKHPFANHNKINNAEWDFTKHWLAIASILLILGAAGLAVPLALRVSSGQYFCNQ